MNKRSRRRLDETNKEMIGRSKAQRSKKWAEVKAIPFFS
jgi:hypothetical protein